MNPFPGITVLGDSRLSMTVLGSFFITEVVSQSCKDVTDSIENPQDASVLSKLSKGHQKKLAWGDACCPQLPQLPSSSRGMYFAVF